MKMLRLGVLSVSVAFMISAAACGKQPDTSGIPTQSGESTTAGISMENGVTTEMTSTTNTDRSEQPGTSNSTQTVTTKSKDQQNPIRTNSQFTFNNGTTATTKKVVPAVEPEPMKLLKKVLTKTPKVTYVPELDYNDKIKAIYYTGENYQNRPSRVFAYIGFPEGASAKNKVPAVVCVHGGGGQAFPQWVEEWNKRGYAAIAMDNYGNMPSSKTGKFVRDPQGAVPPDLSYATINQPIQNQWMYHAVAEAILANSVLRADERVQANKIGLTGISWGGVISGITIGVDNRFAFAVPVYGCGYLSENLTYFNYYKNKRVTDYWGVEKYIPFASSPVLWISGDRDTSFDINCFSKTVQNTPNGMAAIKPAMLHGHYEGWEPAEIYAFADSYCKGGKSMVKIITQPNKSMGKKISVSYQAASGTTLNTVRAYYLTKPFGYETDQYGNKAKFVGEWQFVDGTAGNGKATVTLPDGVYAYYINFVSTSGGKILISSTDYVVLK